MNESTNIIDTHHLTKRFGEAAAVEDINLEVARGSLFGFIGPSGCGKTTTIRLLVGMYRPTEGEVFVFGKPAAAFSRFDRERMGYMPQQFVLYPDLSVWENLNFAASLYGMTGKRTERLNELLELVELTDHRQKIVRQISGGMQRRLSLAAALIHDPELIFLDEPTAGIDPVLRRKIWEYLKGLQADGRTLFVTTQYVGEAAYCDEVGVMAGGRLLMVETPDGLRRRAQGGDVVELRPAVPLAFEHLGQLRALPFVCGEVTYFDASGLHIVVEDGSAAIPKLLAWCEEQAIEVTSITEYVPPFDDVFVRLVQAERAPGKEAAAIK